MNKNIFYNSLIVSIVIQAITGLIDFIALLVKVPIEYNIIIYEYLKWILD
jgi:hypothetical protein